MPEILLRARKDPFEAPEAEDVLARNMVGDNSGNLIFSDAAYKLLATADTRVEVDRFKMDPDLAPGINERYQHYVIPLANAFRLSFEPALIRFTRLIRQLRIPVTVLGVGAQANVKYEAGRLSRIDASVKAFVSAVLDHSPSIGVRGEFTAEYVRSLGFRDVEVIGCPSLYLSGADLRIEKRLATLEPDAKLAINVSPYVTSMGPVIARHLERYPNLRYVAQDLDTLELLLWGTNGATVSGPGDLRPVHLDHPLFREDRARYFVDPWPWFRFLETMDFSFGTRIHGNIAALIAGTPAYVLAHDSRTLELARYFDIPHRLMSEVGPTTDASELYAEADFGPFNAGHPARFRTFIDYLDRHGLDHIHRSPAPSPGFDERKAAVAYAPAITVASRREPDGPRAVLRRIRHRRRRWKRHPLVMRMRMRLARGVRPRVEPAGAD